MDIYGCEEWGIRGNAIYFERCFQEAETNSTLPDNPDMKAVAAFVENINYRVVTGKVEHQKGLPWRS